MQGIPLAEHQTRPSHCDILALGLMFFELLVGRPLQECIPQEWPVWFFEQASSLWRPSLASPLQTQYDTKPLQEVREIWNASIEKQLKKVSDLQPLEYTLCSRLLSFPSVTLESSLLSKRTF